MTTQLVMTATAETDPIFDAIEQHRLKLADLRIVRHRGERGRVGGVLLEPIVPRRAQRRVGLDERRLLARVLRRGSFADKAISVCSSARFRLRRGRSLLPKRLSGGARPGLTGGALLWKDT